MNLLCNTCNVGRDKFVERRIRRSYCRLCVARRFTAANPISKPCRGTPRQRSRPPSRSWKTPSTPPSTLPFKGIGRTSSVGLWRWIWQVQNGGAPKPGRQSATGGSPDTPCRRLPRRHPQRSRLLNHRLLAEDKAQLGPAWVSRPVGDLAPDFSSEADAVEAQHRGYPTATSTAF